MDTTILLLILVVGTIAIAVTALLCRHVITRRRKIRWWLAGVGVIVAMFVSLLFVAGPDIFTSRFWASDQKGPIFAQLLYFVGFCVLASGLPAAATVWYYRATRMT